MNLYSILALIASFFSLSIGIYVFIYGYYNKLNFSFFILSILISIWQFSCFAQSFFLSKEIAIVFDKVLYTSAFFSGLQYIKTIIISTNKYDKYKKILILGYILSIIFFLINWIDPLRITFFIKDIILIEGFRYISKPNILWYVFFVYWIILSIFVMFALVDGLKKTNDRNSRLRVLYYCIASIFIVFNGYIYFLFIFDIFIPFFIFDNIFGVFYSLIMAYAILKHELMDIRLAISKTVSYFISLSFLLLSLTIPFLLFNNKIVLIVSTLLLSVFWAFFFLPLSTLLITTTKRKFIKGYYEPSEVLLQISDTLSNETNRQTIFTQILEIIDNTLELEESTIIMAIRNDNGQLSEYQVLTNNSEIKLAKKSPLIEHFKKDQNIRFSDELEEDTLDVLKKLNYSKQTVIMPLHSPEMLEGVILLGKRSSGKPFSKEDISFLKQTHTLMTSAFYKLTPHEKIEKNFLENQKKLYDAERNLARTERIASMANLIQEYNHEIKTPLAKIVLMLKKLDIPEETKEKFLENTSRIGDIVRTTLRLSSKNENIKKECNINEIIQRTLNFFELKDINLELDLEKKLPLIIGDEEDLQIMFSNLINNANDAMKSVGTLSITTKIEKENVLIIVRDTGCGISEENRASIFEPFFSTHVTKGRGLGLSITFRIIREHLGTIELDSTLGKGTSFFIRLPIKQ
jgi:signal transduction histidine kinase